MFLSAVILCCRPWPKKTVSMFTFGTHLYEITLSWQVRSHNLIKMCIRNITFKCIVNIAVIHFKIIHIFKVAFILVLAECCCIFCICLLLHLYSQKLHIYSVCLLTDFFKFIKRVSSNLGEGPLGPLSTRPRVHLHSFLPVTSLLLAHSCYSHSL